MLSVSWSPNGYQLCSGGDDGLIKVWDLRRRSQALSLPAHSSIVTSLAYDRSGELLASASFDGGVKVWSGRDYGLLRTLKGHQGKVNDVAFDHTDVGGGTPTIVTTGADKTYKVWR